jgi:hypothetical protein
VLARSAGAVLAEIRMRRQLTTSAVLLVEGPSDIPVIRQHIDSSCDVLATFGRDRLLEIVDLADSEGVQGVCGLTDADFGKIRGFPAARLNVVRTDFHDLEMTLASTSALARLIAANSTEVKRRRFVSAYGSIQDALLRGTSVVGAVRLYNEETNSRLKFDGLDWKRFVNRQSLEVDLDAAIVEIRNKSQQPGLDVSAVANRVRAILAASHDPLYLGCGHDLLELIAFSMRGCIGSKQRSATTATALGIQLSLAIDAAEWDGLALTIGLRRWEASNPGFSILSR